MDWRADWALLAKVRVTDHMIWYQFQYRDGTPRCIIADGKRLTTQQVCALLDRAEREREAKRVYDLL